MEWKSYLIEPDQAPRILFGAGGRIGPLEFAQGLVFIVGASWVVSILRLIPGLAFLMGLAGFLISILLAYAWVSIFSKRFHDAGKSGWLTLAAIAVALVGLVVVSTILNPLFGSPSISRMADVALMQSYSPEMIVKNMLTTALVNGALGFYMFRLKATD